MHCKKRKGLIDADSDRVSGLAIDLNVTDSLAGAPLLQVVSHCRTVLNLWPCRDVIQFAVHSLCLHSVQHTVHYIIEATIQCMCPHIYLPQCHCDVYVYHSQ